jgi:hypothetical protein
MTSKPADDARFSLRRWSQRKLESARTEARAPPQPLPSAAAAVQSSAEAAQSAVLPAGPTEPADTPLPPIESLTIDSDFAPFFKPQVDESVKRAALKQLFRDPRFNIMDGLDTYIDDYTQPDPIPSAMLADLMERRVSFALPKTEDAGTHAVGVRTGDRAASHADAIAPPALGIEPVEPIASTDAAPDKARDAVESVPETGVDAKAGKP